jgi:hypothetical protein
MGCQAAVERPADAENTGVAVKEGAGLPQAGVDKPWG